MAKLPMMNVATMSHPSHDEAHEYAVVHAQNSNLARAYIDAMKLISAHHGPQCICVYCAAQRYPRDATPGCNHFE